MRIYATGLSGDIGKIFKKYIKERKIKILSEKEFSRSKYIDLFIHMGASNPRNSIFKIFYSNIFKNILLCFILRKKKIGKFIFFSSIEVYQKNRGQIIFENAPKTTKSFYGFSKLVGEKLFLSFLNCSVLCLRCPAILGKKNVHYIGSLLKKISLNKSIQIDIKKIFFNFFIHPHNIFEFIMNKKLNFNKDSVNICVNPKSRFMNTVNLLKKKVKSKSKIIFYNSGEKNYVLENHKIKTLYRFSPYSIKKSINSWTI